jgi:hypothetical protein
MTIQLQKYLNEISSTQSFYSYVEYMFQNDAIRAEIEEEEFSVMFETLKEFVTGTIDPIGNTASELQRLTRMTVHNSILSGMATLRRQILEFCHSTLEKYLCHVVRVYLHTFPEIMMDIDKKVSFREIVELKDNSSIFSHAVEQEISSFSRLSLEKKKKYLSDRLKLTEQTEAWTLEKEELWKEIDKRRHAIVHEDSPVEVSKDFLMKSMHYIRRLMVAIAIHAQVDQGVKFEFPTMSDYTVSKDRPHLKG